MYSDDYVCLDTSNNGNLPDDINDFDNIINDTIYFGIKFINLMDISYNIELVQNFDRSHTIDIYSGYIEYHQSDNAVRLIPIEYTDTNSISSRSYYDDNSLTPLLSWNGTFSLTLLSGLARWNDSSSHKLILNNRQVTCYFVYNILGHENDDNPPYIIDLNDYI